MKNIISILILIALIAVIALKLNENKQIVEGRVYHFDKEQAINVHTSTLGMQSNKDAKLVTGNFMPNKDAKINSELQGKIVAINVDAGSQVRKGQVLIKLDDSLLKLQLNSLDIKIEGLNVDLKRFKVLVEADAIQGVQLEKVELGLKTAYAQRETILAKIKKTVVYAPFSGIITMKMTEVGSFAAPGIPLLLLTDINKLKFTVNVPESDLHLYKLKRKHNIKVDAFPNVELLGRTTMIGSKSNMGNSYPVQFEVKNTSGLKIKTGMFGKLVFEEEEATERIIISASSIVGSNVKPQVYLVTNGKAMLHDIVIANRSGNDVIIGQGLNIGDKIVTSGFINLFDGVNVVSK